MMIPTKLFLSSLAASALLATSLSAAVSFGLSDYQTVDADGLFPATGSNNIDKFDTLGTGAGNLAPFTTDLYVRGSSVAANTARRVQLFLQFDLTALAADQINTATLEFSAFSLNDLTAAINNPNLFVSQLAADWAAGQPTFDAAAIGSPIDGGGVTSGLGTDQDAGGVFRNVTGYSIDVTSIIQNWQGGDANNGFLLQLGDSTSNQGIGIDGATVMLNVDAIPEPSSMGLLSVAGLLLLRRRRSC